MRNWVLKVVAEFQNDQMVRKFGIIVLLEQVLGLYGKKEIYDKKGISLTSNIVLYIPTVRFF